MKVPTHRPPHWLVTNGKGRLFIQPVLPRGAKVRMASGDDLYRYGGEAYPPNRNTGPAPACRIEVSPPQPRAEDVFLHVLTATDSGVESVPAATADVQDGRVTVTVGGARIAFCADAPGGRIELNGKTAAFPERLVADYLSGP